MTTNLRKSQKQQKTITYAWVMETNKQIWLSCTEQKQWRKKKSREEMRQHTKHPLIRNVPYRKIVASINFLYKRALNSGGSSTNHNKNNSGSSESISHTGNGYACMLKSTSIHEDHIQYDMSFYNAACSSRIRQFNAFVRKNFASVLRWTMFASHPKTKWFEHRWACHSRAFAASQTP